MGLEVLLQLVGGLLPPLEDDEGLMMLPLTGSGFPMTAASATAWWKTRALSTSAVPLL